MTDLNNQASDGDHVGVLRGWGGGGGVEGSPSSLMRILGNSNPLPLIRAAASGAPLVNRQLLPGADGCMNGPISGPGSARLQAGHTCSRAKPLITDARRGEFLGEAAAPLDGKVSPPLEEPGDVSHLIWVVIPSLPFPSHRGLLPRPPPLSGPQFPQLSQAQGSQPFPCHRSAVGIQEERAREGAATTKARRAGGRGVGLNPSSATS